MALNKSLFKKRKNILPYEYPQLLKYKEAIQHSYWLFSHFTYGDSIQDYHVNANPVEKSVVTRAMLAISQVEVGVKTFWGNLYNLMPCPEIGIVGAVNSESEVRHFDSYRHILELLDLNDLFKEIHKFPALQARVDYTETILENKEKNEQETVLSMALFSLFIEHVSLFSQFYIMSSFDKHRNMFSGLSNLILATSKEEELHGRFGIELYNILRREVPELFTPEFFSRMEAMARQAFEAEMGIVDWIFEEGDLEFLTKEQVKNYIKHRYNNSCKELGIAPHFEVNEDMYRENTLWFDATILGMLQVDFFSEADVNYVKGHGFTAENIFAENLAPQGT